MSGARADAGSRGIGWPIEVFALDDCSVQLTWRASPAGGLRIEVGGSAVSPQASAKAELVLDRGGLVPTGHGEKPRGGGAAAWAEGVARRYWGTRRVLDPAWPGGPGSVIVDGLSPGTSYEVVASAEGLPRFVAARLVTLRRPEGDLLCKFATVSDVHIGERFFGVLGRIHDQLEPPPREGNGLGGPWHAGQGRASDWAGERAGEVDVPGRVATCPAYPERSLRAAIQEATDWGAELLVAKGDLTRVTTPAEVRDVGRLLAGSPVPVEAVLGNHDNRSGVNIRAVLEAQGIVVPWQPSARDLPGIRLVLGSTAHGDPRYHRGQFPEAVARRVVALAKEAPGPAWVGLHHPPESHRFPTVYPPGFPFAEGRFLLEELARAKPASFVSFGHRHRNRRYSYGPLPLTEVGSTKDYPGVWAGYKVFEGGVVQVVRRISAPDVLAWTEATRRAMNGQWGRWSPGRLPARCFTHFWPVR